MVPWMRPNTGLANLLRCMETLRFYTMTLRITAEVAMDPRLNTRNMGLGFNEYGEHSFTTDGIFGG